MKSYLLLIITAIVLTFIPKASFGQSPSLGTTSSFSVFTSAGDFNNNGASTISGDIGTDVGALNGFPPGIVINGIMYTETDPYLATVSSDLGLLYTDLFSRLTTSADLGVTLGNGQVLTPGVYSTGTGAAATLAGNLTLDGQDNPNALFIIKIDGAFATSTNANVFLINGASASNVFWQVTGAVTVGDNTAFRGNIVSGGAIELLEASTLYGRALTRAGAITLHNNVITKPFTAAPAVTLIQPTCAITTGTITITSPLGTGITYSIGGAYQSGTVFSGLASGPYSVTASSGDGISSATIVSILAAPPTPGIPMVNITNPTCANATGSISITSPLGAGMTYSIGGSYQPGTIFLGLASGDYTLTAKNADGCMSTSNFTILSQPLTPADPTASVIHPDCSIGTGTITVTSPLGAGITYSIGGVYQASPIFTGVLPGPYIVTAMNTSGGCISSGTNVIVLQQPPTPADPTASVIQPDCSIGTGTITVTSPLGAGITYSIGGIYQVSPIFTGVLPGPYNVTAMNTSGGCISSGTNVIVLQQPSTPSAPTASVIQPDCSIGTGTITVTSPLGAGITYSIGGMYQVSPIFTVVLPGLYNVTAMNTSGGCISSGTNVIVLQQPMTPATPQATVLQPDCSIGTGTITVTSPLGAGITYSIGGIYQASPVFTGVLPGTYIVTAMNSTGGCISLGTNIIVLQQPLTPAAPQAIVLQPDCSIGTGTITVTSPLGAGISYSIGGVYQASPVFISVVPGSYNVTAMNTSGSCISSGTNVIVLQQPLTPAAPQATVLQPDCSIGTGTITVTSPLGAGITYSIGGVYQANPVFTGVLPGTYIVTAMNSAGGCISLGTNIIVLQQPLAPAAPQATVLQPDCSIGTGTITVTSPLGAGITYSIGGVYQASPVFIGVVPGSYNVTAMNTSGSCISSGTNVIVLQQPLTPADPQATVLQPDCSIGTGTITVTSPLGAGITYSIGGVYQASPVFTGVLPGTYIVTAKNSAGGCISLGTNVIVLQQPLAPAAPQATVLQPDCSIGTGTITVTSPLGAGITYSIGGVYQASPVFTGVLPGTYIVTAKNSTGGCISLGTNVIVLQQPLAPAAPQATVLQPDCSIGTGTITVTSPLGAGITYSIGGVYQASPVFIGVVPGSYNVTAMNTSGSCISSGTNVIVLQQPLTPAAPQATVLQPDCSIGTGTITVTSPLGAGITYSIGGVYQASPVFTGVLPGTYIVTAKNSTGGCISLGTNVIVLQQPLAPAAPQATVLQPDCSIGTGTITVTSPLGAGITYSIGGVYQASPVFTGVLPGTYIVTAKNSAGGCISLGTNVIVLQQPLTPAAPQATVLQPDCSIGTGTITVTSPLGAGITYSIGGVYQASPVFTGVLPGTYIVTAKNSAGGCISLGTNVIVLQQPLTPAAPQATVLQPDCSIGTGTITVTSPLGAGITYSIGGVYQASPVFTGVLPGTYIVTAKNSTGGCISLGTNVIVLQQPPTTGPTIFIKGATNICQNSPDETYTATATNSTSIRYSVLPITAGVINEFTGVMNWYSEFNGIVTIKAISTGICGSTNAEITVNVNPLTGPAGTIKGAVKICQSTTGVIFSVPLIANATRYIWTLPEGATITAGENTNVITVSFNENALSGLITVKGSNDCGDGLVSGLEIIVITTPVAIAYSNSPVCEGSSINLRAVSLTGGIYIWTGPNGFSSNMQNPVINNASSVNAGVYTLILATSCNCCYSDPVSINVVVNNCNISDLEILNTVNNSEPFIGTNIVFTVTATNNGPDKGTGVVVSDKLPDGYTYVSSSTSVGTYDPQTGNWEIGNMNVGESEILLITAKVEPTGSYTSTTIIDGIEEDSNLENNTSTVTTYPTDFFIPDAFSPNGDGVNDLFVIRGIKNYKDNTFIIYNRWGNKVYEASPYNNNWNGNSMFGLRIGGNELPTGTYFYLLNLGNGSEVIKGTIYLNR